VKASFAPVFPTANIILYGFQNEKIADVGKSGKSIKIFHIFSLIIKKF